jgi:hypothetical protein
MTDHESNALPNNIDEALEGFFIAGVELLTEVRRDWDREKEIIRAQTRELTIDLDAALAPLKERLARLEGQIGTVVSLLGTDAGDNRAKSKARLKAKRQDNGGRLSEAPGAP